MSWLEEAIKEGHEPDLKPQEVPSEEHDDKPSSDPDGDYWV